MDKDNIVDISPSIEEKRWENILIQLAKEVFGPSVLLKLPNWKYTGVPLIPESPYLMKLEGWKKTMFAISDIAAANLADHGHSISPEKAQCQMVSLKAIRDLFWAIIKLNYIPGKELAAKSLDGGIVLVEISKIQGGNKKWVQ